MDHNVQLAYIQESPLQIVHNQMMDSMITHKQKNPFHVIYFKNILINKLNLNIIKPVIFNVQNALHLLLSVQNVVIQKHHYQKIVYTHQTVINI